MRVLGAKDAALTLVFAFLFVLALGQGVMAARNIVRSFVVAANNPVPARGVFEAQGPTPSCFIVAGSVLSSAQMNRCFWELAELRR